MLIQNCSAYVHTDTNDAKLLRVIGLNEQCVKKHHIKNVQSIGSSINFLQQLITLARYVFGPFPPTVCQIEYLVRNILIHKMVFVLICTLTTRYIYIVHSKNPTAIQDDFWHLFLEIWGSGKWYNMNYFQKVLFLYK